MEPEDDARQSQVSQLTHPNQTHHPLRQPAAPPSQLLSSSSWKEAACPVCPLLSLWYVILSLSHTHKEGGMAREDVVQSEMNK